MPQIVNTFVLKVLRLVKEFFQADTFEYGIIEVGPSDSGKTIFVPTGNDVLRVWFSLEGGTDPYLEVFGHSKHCYVSDGQPVPGGFQFEPIVHGKCKISWFAIQR